jgi:pyruvate-formate lyase-activating enzyme
VIDFASGLTNAVEIDFIPFHSLAREKYVMLGKEYLFRNDTNVDKTGLMKFVEYAREKGLNAKILN